MLGVLWFVAMLFAILIVIAVVVFFVETWLSWTVVNIVGAGRKVFVGIHGWTGNAVVKPDPVVVTDPGTVFKGPLVRPLAYVNPDRDELRIKVIVSPEGGPSSNDEKDACVAVLRISWSIAPLIRFRDQPERPGDHGKIPENVRYRVKNLPRRSRKMVPQLQGQGWVVPGAAAIAFMNNYTEGEHLERLLEFVTHHTREFFGSFSVHELMRVKQADTPKDPPGKILYRRARIRGEDVEIPYGKGKDELPEEYRTMGELQQVISHVLTFVCREELDPYGLYANDITLVTLGFPQKLVDASRAKETRRDDAENMRIFTDALATNVTKATAVGVDPDISALVLSDATRDDKRTSLFAVLLKALETWKK